MSQPPTFPLNGTGNLALEKTIIINKVVPGNTTPTTGRQISPCMI